VQTRSVASFRLRRKIRDQAQKDLISVRSEPVDIGTNCIPSGPMDWFITEFVIGLIWGGVGSILLLRWACSQNV